MAEFLGLVAFVVFIVVCLLLGLLFLALIAYAKAIKH